MKSAISTDNAPRPVGPYSQGIKVGDFLFVSGQVSIDPKTGEMVGETIEEQTRLTLENTKAIVEAGGATMADVVKVTAVLSDMSNFSAFNEVYQTFFSSPPPSRICYAASLLGRGRLLVEIDAIAYVGNKSS